jgi:hypothetical protein
VGIHKQAPQIGAAMSTARRVRLPRMILSFTLLSLACALTAKAGPSCENETTLHPGMNMGAPAVDMSAAPCPDVQTCSSRCCNNTLCKGFTFTTYQPLGAPLGGPFQCAQGEACCWLKGGAVGSLSPETNCTSGIPPANFFCSNGTKIYEKTDTAGSAGTDSPAPNASVCLARCCADPDCAAWTFTPAQPGGGTAQCKGGTPCCWLKQSGFHLVPQSDCCTSGVVPTPPSPPPGAYAVPSLSPVATLVSAPPGGSLRQPSPMVQDTETGRWHFWADFVLKGAPDTSAVIHHFSAPNVTGRSGLERIRGLFTH